MEMQVDQTAEVAAIKSGLVAIFEGKSKRLSIVAALSIATTTAHMTGMPETQLHEMVARMYAKRVAEAKK